MPPAQRQCRNGHHAEGTDSYCTTCGEPILEVPDPSAQRATSTCPNGHQVGAELAFCPQCGAGLGRSRLSSAPTAATTLASGVAAQPPVPASAAPAPGYGYAAVPPPPGYGYAAPGSYSAPYGYPVIAPMNGLAIASFVVSLVWVWWVNAIVALVLGIVALGQIKDRGQREAPPALAGIIISACELALLLAVIIALVVAGNASSSGLVPLHGALGIVTRLARP